MYEYEAEFYEYINRGSLNSARTIIPLLLKSLTIKSVLDVGCGQGAWMRAWQEHGVQDLVGLDGPYVDRQALLVPTELFRAVDLTKPFRLDQRFDLVQSLEVAEHLPHSSAEAFVSSLVAHASIVYFSAATPGQGGENHVNERPPSYWRAIFAKHGYVLVDHVRPHIRDAADVEPWYRYNSFLYLDTQELGAVPDAIRSHILAENERIPDFAPLAYRVREALLRCLPAAAVTALSRLKHRVVIARRRNARD